MGPPGRDVPRKWTGRIEEVSYDTGSVDYEWVGLLSHSCPDKIMVNCQPL